MEHTARPFAYHEGERFVQERAGQTAAATASIAAIHAAIPPPAATFLAERQLLVVAARDADGRVWATQLTGPPGFVHVEDERTVRVDARAAAGDPLADVLARSLALGTIAIDFETRRRMRLNGIATGDARGLTIVTEEVYANCPKFIAARSIEALAETVPALVQTIERLDDAARALIAMADTFFIGTAHDERGADASHRGGNAGFVEVLDDRTLLWPDYRGNAMFMTLGNIVESPRAGLLFIDWTSGTTLQLSGTAAIEWDGALAARYPGAQRVVRFAIDRSVTTAHASPLRWSPATASRVNPPLAPRSMITT